MSRIRGARTARGRLALVPVLALVLVPAQAGAADRFAAPDGDGAEPCLQADPCPLVVAVEGAGIGDDVTLLGGVPPAAPYTTSSLVTVSGGITVHGAPGARPLVVGNPISNFTFRVNQGSVLRDVAIDHQEINNTGVFVVGGLVERVFSKSAGQSGCTADGGAVIRDSVCWTTSSASSSAGVNVQWNVGFTSEATLRNVTAVSTGAGAGLRVVGATLPDIHVTAHATNVIARGGGSSDVVAQGSGCCTGVISEVILDHSNYDSELEDDMFADARITDPGSPTNVTTEPVFLDAAAGDFRQAATSAGTINRGTAAVVQGTGLGLLDLDGQARNLGLAPDVGADEFPAPPAPTGLIVAPASGSDENSPRVSGTAPGAATVELFTDAACTASVAAGSAAEFEGAGIPVAVPDNSTTTFWAQSADSGGFLSACSTASVTYSEVTPSSPPTPPPASGANLGPTGQRAAALRKCAKIKKQAKKKRKKCRRKARKLPV